MMRFGRVALASAFALGVACAANAASLESMLPRGKLTCYGGPPKAGATIQRIRVTRPERLQSYDSAGSRMVRIVINFAAPKGGRMEDTATCAEKDGAILCVSTSCDGASFMLEQAGAAPRLRLEAAAPTALWSCAEGDLRTVTLTPQQRIVPVMRGTGACIEP